MFSTMKKMAQAFSAAYRSEATTAPGMSTYDPQKLETLVQELSRTALYRAVSTPGHSKKIEPFGNDGVEQHQVFSRLNDQPYVVVFHSVVKDGRRNEAVMLLDEKRPLVMRFEKYGVWFEKILPSGGGETTTLSKEETALAIEAFKPIVEPLDLEAERKLHPVRKGEQLSRMIDLLVLTRAFADDDWSNSLRKVGLPAFVLQHGPERPPIPPTEPQ